MGRPQLSALEYPQHLPPVVDEMLGPLRADALADQRSQLAFERGELTPREPAIPCVAVAHLDLDEADAGERRSGLGHVRHVVGNAFEAEELEHLFRIRTAPVPQPIADDQPAA